MFKSGTLGLRSPHERMRLLLAGGAAVLAALTLISLLITPQGSGIRKALWWEEPSTRPNASATAGLAAGVHGTAAEPTTTSAPTTAPARTTKPPAVATTTSAAPAVRPAAPSTTTAAPPVTMTGTVEAEAATLVAGARILSCAFCSGGEKAGWIGRDPNATGTGASAVFKDVRVANTRDYQLTISYVGGDRTFFVGVNGSSGVRVFLATADWSRTRTTLLTVRLTAGTANTITFYNPDNWTPDLDKITIG